MSQKILLVEDDLTTADFISKSLTGEGFVVDHAADGRLEGDQRRAQKHRKELEGIVEIETHRAPSFAAAPGTRRSAVRISRPSASAMTK